MYMEGRFNIIKMKVLPNLSWRVRLFPMQMRGSNLVDIDKLIVESHVKAKDTARPKTTEVEEWSWTTNTMKHQDSVLKVY